LAAAEPIDVTRASIVVRPGTLPAAELAAGQVLREELQKRTGVEVTSGEPPVLGELKEYPVPAAALTDGRVVVTFDPIDEQHLNWRQHSRLSEAWLVRVR
jgi:hypothetical protein